MTKKIILKIIILLQIIIFSCTSIAALPEEPEPPIEHTLKSLSIYEAQLVSYALYLETFLIRTKEKLGNKNFPSFTLLEADVLRDDHTLEAVKENIMHLKRYINNIKPIAISVYKKYSKLKK
ncbi:hypothetical protein baBA2_000975 (plasmid) [Borrelia anserina]|uniref:Outer surface protein n=2 Tax=Borrelia anserina TaxID=143 RepID=W5SP55_BORAN|nr:BBA14 family lipoprotein [Borrelia anserina]AHH08954.1 Outer surface protein [Borrelia anserina BA2]APR65381.1 hypothetical protein N187_A62 [Borrelia anserina Es]UPA07344.1 hypothetical protein baBA2_000975 [Borrelia anserina]